MIEILNMLNSHPSAFGKKKKRKKAKRHHCSLMLQLFTLPFLLPYSYNLNLKILSVQRVDELVGSLERWDSLAFALVEGFAIDSAE